MLNSCMTLQVDDRNKECYVTLENETRIWVPFSELYSNAGQWQNLLLKCSGLLVVSDG